MTKVAGNLVLLVLAGLVAIPTAAGSGLCVSGAALGTMTSGFSCTYDNLTFSNFSYQYADRSSSGVFQPGTTNVTAALVQVTWETDASGVLSIDFTTAPGTGGWAVAAGDQTDINLGYSVTTAFPSPVGINTYYIAGEGLQAQGQVSNNVPAGTPSRIDSGDKGNIQVAETVFPNTGLAVSPTVTLAVGENNIVPPAAGSDTTTLLTVSNAGNLSGLCPAAGATPNSNCLDALTATDGIKINKDIAISGGQNVAGGYTNSADLISLFEPLLEVQYVPEPLGLALTGCGLIALGLLGRKGRRNKN